MNEEWAQTRLEDLRSEEESGRRILAETEERAADLRRTLLRISGAIQVLEEGLKVDEVSQEADETLTEDADGTVSHIASSA